MAQEAIDPPDVEIYLPAAALVLTQTPSQRFTAKRIKKDAVLISSCNLNASPRHSSVIGQPLLNE
jgi:hypothetical protein